MTGHVCSIGCGHGHGVHAHAHGGGGGGGDAWGSQELRPGRVFKVLSVDGLVWSLEQRGPLPQVVKLNLVPMCGVILYDGVTAVRPPLPPRAVEVFRSAARSQPALTSL